MAQRAAEQRQAAEVMEAEVSVWGSGEAREEETQVCQEWLEKDAEEYRQT